MNKYDQAEIDLTSLLQRALKTRPRQGPAITPLDIFGQKIKFYGQAVLYRLGIWQRLVSSNLAIGWFDDFRHYWMHELDMRRIDLPDFFYLRGVYRSRFQAVAVSQTQEEDAAFLTPWQRAATLYLLFSYVYKLALHPIYIWQIKNFIKRGNAVCEYGCGVAPVLGNLAHFYPDRRLTLTGADIPTIMLHYARWRLQNFKNVTIQQIDPNDDAPLTDQYNLITCLTVFEHLPRPLAIVKHLHDHLKPRGYFVFDYIKAAGTGLDTAGAVRERQQVLDFVRSNFAVVKGKIPDKNVNIKMVICRKI